MNNEEVSWRNQGNWIRDPATIPTIHRRVLGVEWRGATSALLT